MVLLRHPAFLVLSDAVVPPRRLLDKMQESQLPRHTGIGPPSLPGRLLRPANVHAGYVVHPSDAFLRSDRIAPVIGTTCHTNLTWRLHTLPARADCTSACTPAVTLCEPVDYRGECPIKNFHDFANKLMYGLV